MKKPIIHFSHGISCPAGTYRPPVLDDERIMRFSFGNTSPGTRRKMTG